MNRMWVVVRCTGLTNVPRKRVVVVRDEHAQWVSDGPADTGKSKQRTRFLF